MRVSHTTKLYYLFLVTAISFFHISSVKSQETVGIYLAGVSKWINGARETRVRETRACEARALETRAPETRAPDMRAPETRDFFEIPS